MSNDDERDYAEEQYNARTMRDEDEMDTIETGPEVIAYKDPQGIEHNARLHRSLATATDKEIYACGECGRSWCGICTPTPSARCPFEYEHAEAPDPKRETIRVTFDISVDPYKWGVIYGSSSNEEARKDFREYIDVHTLADALYDGMGSLREAEGTVTVVPNA